MSTSLSFAVSMMIGTDERVRSSRHTSVPGRPGSIRSSSTRSAPSRSKAASASRPSAAISVSYPSRRSRNESGSLSDGSSSTIRMRVTSLLRAVVGESADVAWVVRRAGRRGRLRRLGKPDGEGGSAALLRPHPHLAAVVLHGVLDDAEAEAGAAGVAAAGVVDAEEALEHAVALALGDADALVGDGDLDDAVGVGHADPDAEAVRRVLDGVGDQVVHGGDEQLLVAVDLGAGVPAADQRDAVRFGGDPVAVDRLGDHGVDVDLLGRGERRPRPAAG